MFGLGGLIGDVLTIATAPIRIAAPIIRTVTEPVAEVVEEIVESVEDSLK